jgi:hypothetical protein
MVRLAITEKGRTMTFAGRPVVGRAAEFMAGPHRTRSAAPSRRHYSPGCDGRVRRCLGPACLQSWRVGARRSCSKLDVISSEWTMIGKSRRCHARWKSPLGRRIRAPSDILPVSTTAGPVRATRVLGLRCSWCPETAQMPRILGLHALPPAAMAAASKL